MKPISIRFRCFGPYMAEQFVDFSQLEQSGLFLICGETGAGKTTILDAMCYALYGKSSGGLRGDMGVMRCALAGKNDETFVEFIFDCAGQRYKFTRSLKYGRKNLNDSHNCMVLRDGEYVPIFANPKATFVNKKAEELIGLSYEQFRQVIILPQGQFEKLLVSDSAEKEKILVSLFHADRWQKIAEEIYRRVVERDNALKLEQQAIRLKLGEFGCDNIQALTALKEQAAQQMATEKQELEQLGSRLEIARRNWDALLLENQDFAELEKRKAQLSALLPKVAQFDREEQLLTLARQAETLRPYHRALEDARNQHKRTQTQLQKARTELDSSRDALNRAQQAQERHRQEENVQQQRQKDLTLLENARGVYETLSQKEKEAARGEENRKKAETALNRAQREFARADGAWQQALTDQNRAMEDYRQAQQLYLQGIGSVLAQGLQAGEPCPVCGALEHPTPAKPAEGHISDAQLEQYNQAMNDANDRVNLAMKARSEAESKRTDTQQLHRMAGQQAALAKQEYENALSARIGGIENGVQLESRIARTKEKIEAYARQAQILLDALTKAQGALIGAENSLHTWEKELQEAEAALQQCRSRWETALAESALDSESQFLTCAMEPRQLQNRSDSLIQFRIRLENARQAVQEQQTLLEGKTAPDLTGAQQALQELEKQQNAQARNQALLEQRVSAMEQTCADLQQRAEKLEHQRIRVDEDLEFANRLRGRSGLSLQRYVLGVMLTSIASAANCLLRNVYGGRYQLYRTDEIAGSGRKGGLELEVYDAASNERRSVTTLSGGEKFLVALSLAIGLSTVVQAQGSGVRLEAMFIDEGFGSLDRESVQDALEVLQGIQRSAGVVGIISHVEQLAEAIPTKIEVRKGQNGSTCRVIG